MKKLTPEEVRLLGNLPPFLCSCSDIVIQYFGENHSNAAWKFLCTLLQLRENLKFIKRRRRVEEQSLTMASSSSTSNSIQNIEKNVTKETRILQKKKEIYK